MVLQVEESCGALDVGQGFRASHFLPLEYLPRTEGPPELARKLFQVVLHHAVQGHQVAVDIVKYFDRSRLREQEVQRPAASEDFNVAFMGWEQGDKAVGQAAFIAHPGNDG